MNLARIKSPFLKRSHFTTNNLIWKVMQAIYSALYLNKLSKALAHLMTY